jgi:hypothetical protein
MDIEQKLQRLYGALRELQVTTQNFNHRAKSWLSPAVYGG